MNQRQTRDAIDLLDRVIRDIEQIDSPEKLATFPPRKLFALLASWQTSLRNHRATLRAAFDAHEAAEMEAGGVHYHIVQCEAGDGVPRQVPGTQTYNSLDAAAGCLARMHQAEIARTGDQAARADADVMLTLPPDRGQLVGLLFEEQERVRDRVDAVLYPLPEGQRSMFPAGTICRGKRPDPLEMLFGTKKRARTVRVPDIIEDAGCQGSPWPSINHARDNYRTEADE